MIGTGVRRIFLARAVTDMRRSFDTLAGMVSSQLGQYPLSGDAFVFVGRKRTTLKVLLWSEGGFWLCSRRLARGTFALPSPAEARDATGAIALELSGPAMLIGDNPFALWGGLGAVWIRAGEKAGQAVLTARHTTLGSRKIVIDIQPAPPEAV